MFSTQLKPVPLTPEISLHLADDHQGLFSGDFHSDQPPPFWAFVWAGGQSLARYLLDNPAQAAGKRVLEVACGSGVASIAAARCGAASVCATDIDPDAVAAARRNAAANGVNLAETEDAPDLVLAGDVFYSPSVAPQMTSFLRAARKAGATVLVGDPGRGYFPGRLFERVAEYTVPVPAALEEAESLVCGIWKMK
ncbi:class I SAM-dependent methyltransferase [Actinoplanes sp. CA-015351]|uniref:class I SAM-dependent methyltransferase n=1 Tax=Actinoplanes sp. CA-015351 TaxID=3239897 RepID=UPI003D99DC99